jgi:hypothetical protein
MQADFVGHGLAFSETRRPIYFFQAAGGAKIVLRLNVRRTSTNPDGRTYRIAGWLSAGARHNRVMVCPLTVENILNPSHVDTPMEMTGFVSHDQLRVLEELRNGGDMEISMNLEVVCLAEGPVRFDGRTTQEVFWLTPGEWSEAVARIEAGTFVELLIPITRDSGFATAAGRLRDARDDVRDGQYEEAIKKARAALEPVKAAHSSGALLSAARAKTDPRQRDQPERWAVLIDAAFSLLSGAVHDDSGVTENFTWSRADAVALIATVGGLLRRLADEMPHNPI